MSRPARRPFASSLFPKLLALRDRLAALFGPRRAVVESKPVKLHVETMEERVVPEGRPLPYPVGFVGDSARNTVRAYNLDTGELRWSQTVFGANFTGGVRVGAGDVTGDGVPDAVVAPGPGADGHAPRVKVLDGVDGELIDGPLSSFLAFGSNVTSGVFVAAADVNGDGRQDVLAAALTPNGNPRVKAFDSITGDSIANFVVSGASFEAGITLAAADLTGDGKAEAIVGAGANGRVRIYDPLTGETISHPLANFRAFGNTYTGGVFVSSDQLAGDVDGDGVPDVAVSTDVGSVARVKVFSGADGSVLYDFQPFGSSFTGGARTALAFADDDEHADIVVGMGAGGSQVKVFSGADGTQLASPLGSYSPFGSSLGGVFVAASNDPLPITLLGTGPGTWKVGQVVRQVWTITGQQFPTAIQPTGTVTFTAQVFGGVTYNLGTVSVVATGTGYSATATLDTGSLPAGSYSLTATYSGDSNYNSGFSMKFVTVSAAASGVPVPLSKCGCDECLVRAPAGDYAAPSGQSAGGVSYATGGLSVRRTDLSSSALGDAWGVSWSWTNQAGYADGVSGSGGSLGQFAHLVQVNGNDSVALVTGAASARFFDLYGGAYHARYGESATLTHNTGAGEFVVADGTGRTLIFYDFSGGTPSGRAGKLRSITDADGQVTEVTSWDGSGNPDEVQRTTGSGGSALTESFVYSYVASGTNAGLLESVLQRTQVGTGSWATVRSVEYTYHDGTTSAGTAGALRTATVKDAGGTAIDTAYYRYYTSGTGSTGNLKYAFGTAAYGQLVGALGSSVDSLTDGQVDDYASAYAEYDSSGRVTKIISAGAGCSVCSGGQGEFTYAYTTNSSAGLLESNRWHRKVIETLPNGTTNTVYTNAFGQVMLTAVDDGTNEWLSFTRYDDTGRVVLNAGPSAVTGFSESNADLVGYSSGNASYISDSTGLVTVYTYAASTTATTSTAGDATGYLKAVDIKQGETGTAVPQSALTYIANTVSGTDYFHVATSTAYRNDNGTGVQTVSFAYTFTSGTNQVASTTVTLPTVTTAQNGSNSATSAVTVNDAAGRQVWAKDPGGFISYTAYDDLTGGVLKTIVDVDTTQTTTFANLPSGWSTPSGGGLHLTTSYEVDALGRATKVTHPNGRIDYTVFDDAAHETRYYPGWNTTTNAPTGPTVVTRMDRANGYTETLTMSATPSVSSGRPTGAESIVAVQSLSRSYTNEAGQVTHTDAYFNLSGLAYSTSTTLGTEGTHFYRTRYQYDNTGAVKRVQTPEGTILRTVRDGVGRVVSEWVGTDDTPTSGFWSPTNTTGTNLVKVSEYEYDGGGVGDSNLTTVTEFPGGGATNRVTETLFDWRNRVVAIKSGVETTESTGVNRPLVTYTYDNLGQVTLTQMYDGDGVTPSISSGVLSLPGGTSAKLRAQSGASYDELGRVYRSDTYSVDPSSGTVGSNTLYSLSWFDARGNVLKTAAPGGLVAKYTTDGAGRLVASYITDGGGDSGYSDADDVTGDIVLEQTELTHDASGNVLTTTTRQRFHDASGTGALGSPSSGISARVSYAGFYYDLADRMTAAVDVGTNGGSAWTRPGSVPSSSATAHVNLTRYATDAVQNVTLTGGPTGGTFTLSFGGYTTSAIAYNASAATVDSALEALTSVGSGNVAVVAAPGGSGWDVRFTGTLADKYQSALTASGAGLTGGTSPGVSVATVNAGGDVGVAAEVVDPAGREHRSYADPLGRTVRSVENFADGVVSDGDDKTVGYTYNGAGMTSLTAYLTGGGGQTTGWLYYSVSQANGSAIDSKDMVGTTQWPDETLGLASSGQQESLTLNALGQVVTTTDRNGNVHTLTYDVLGRVVSDAVTTLGFGVDGAVRRVETAYDEQGNAYKVTSFDAASGGNIVNEVLRTFNGLGQLTAEYQSHGGAVNTSTTPKVQYAWAEMPSGENHSRLTSVTYPDGYVLAYNYSSGLNSNISRLSSLSDTTGTLESYSYLGLGGVVVRSHPQPDVDLSYVKRSGESDGAAGDKYTGLDLFGRVIDQRWLNPTSGTATDRFGYDYDLLGNRVYRDNLVNTAFGELYAYDAMNQLVSFDRGTLNGTKTGLTGAASRAQDWDYDAVGNLDSVTTNGTAQSRTANRQNEITSIGGATTPTYDVNGNMTGDETGKQFVYDAWNRMVAVKNSGGTTLKTYAYDGLNRRVTETAGGTTTDLFYSADWQVLAEKVGANTTQRYVWSPVYVDAMVLRDRDTNADGTLDERLWVQQDANWNVTALVDGSGAVVERYAYDPYGVRTVYDANWNVRSGGSSYDFQHGFQGMFFDAVAGLNSQRFRWYSPTLGRWVTMDPIQFAAGDVNLYRMEGNNSPNSLDWMGLAEFVRHHAYPVFLGGLDGIEGGGQMLFEITKTAEDSAVMEVFEKHGFKATASGNAKIEQLKRWQALNDNQRWAIIKESMVKGANIPGEVMEKHKADIMRGANPLNPTRPIDRVKTLKHNVFNRAAIMEARKAAALAIKFGAAVTVFGITFFYDQSVQAGEESGTKLAERVGLGRQLQVYGDLGLLPSTNFKMQFRDRTVSVELIPNPADSKGGHFITAFYYEEVNNGAWGFIKRTATLGEFGLPAMERHDIVRRSDDYKTYGFSCPPK